MFDIFNARVLKEYVFFPRILLGKHIERSLRVKM
jgi:hypothetical protein